MLQQFFSCSPGSVAAHKQLMLPAVTHQLNHDDELVVVAGLNALSRMCDSLGQNELGTICTKILNLTTSTASDSVR